MIIARGQVIYLLDRAGVYRPTWNVADAEFTTLDRDWVVNVAWPNWVKSLPPELVETVEIGGKPIRRPKWIKDVFDCENHTQDFKTYVTRCCAVDCVNKGVPRGGTALGSMSYLAVLRGGHDLAVFIDHEQRVHWFDPGDGNFVEPEPIEVASVWEGDMR